MSLGLSAQQQKPLLGEVAIKYQDKRYVLNGQHTSDVVKDFQKKLSQNIQQPNEQFFGLELQLIIYQMADAQDEQRVKTWFKDSTWINKAFTFWFDQRGQQLIKERYLWINETLRDLGEKPVYFSRRRFNQARRRLELVFQKYGFFDIEILPSFRVQGDKVDVEFYAYHEKLYKVDSVRFTSDSEIVKSNLAPLQDSLRSIILATDSLYVEDRMVQVSQGIVTHFRNNGFYDFYNNNISIVLDTIGLDNRVKVEINIPVNDSKIDQLYRLRYVNVYPDYTQERNLDAKGVRITADQTYFRSQSSGFYIPYLRQAIGLKKGEYFAASKQDMTYQNLHSSALFSKIDIKYDKIDSLGMLDVEIFLPPIPRYSISWTNDVSLSNTFFRMNTGVDFSVMNMFGVSDKTSFNANYSLLRFTIDEAQSIQAEDFSFEANTRLPYALTNLIGNQQKVPTTLLSSSVGRTFQSGVQQNVANLSFEEQYEFDSSSQLKFKYIDLGFNSNVNGEESLKRALDLYYPRLRDSLYSPRTKGNVTFYDLNTDKFKEWTSGFVQDPVVGFMLVEQQRLELILQENFIAASSLEYISGRQTEGAFYRFAIESAGHWILPFESLLDKKETELSGIEQFALFGVPYAQYLKLDVDYKYYLPLSLNSKLATRAFVGIAMAYGNSKEVPFRKQYFSGGSNDNRAWASLSLGPGRQPVFNTNSLSLRSGDVKILWSLEYRFDVWGNLEGAVFTDVSNIWMLKDDVAKEAVFHFQDFYEELAIGSGLGLRYNLGFLVARADFAWKVYDPARLNVDNPWVIKEQKLTDFIFNFGIGYPF